MTLRTSRRRRLGAGLVAFTIASSLTLASASSLPNGDDEGIPVRPADEFHPAKGDGKAPLYGGRVIVHISSLPENMNYVIENSAITRQMLYETHETLLLQDWLTAKYVPAAAESWVEESLVVLNADAPNVAGEIETSVIRRDGGEGLRAVRAVYGEVTKTADGFTIKPLSSGSALESEVSVPASSVDVVERGSVFTMKLRDGVRWHKSTLYTDEEQVKQIGEQTLNADDVHFSWSIYANPDVECDEKRFQFTKIVDCQVIDPLNVRFFYESQYAFALDSIGTSLTLLPSHIYNLADPDCPDHDKGASMKAQAEHVNKNEHNKRWVGIGPYQVVEWDQQYVQAVRFRDSAGKPAYFDLEGRPGNVDEIRWRYIEDDQTAMVALENGELDFFDRVKPEDYFGDRTEKDSFSEKFYKGYFYLGIFGYTGWNLYNPKLSDPAVRTAIAHAVDFEAYRISQYKGLARQITGPVPFDSPGYNHEVKALEYDVDKAIEILEDAGWYDRNNNGIADKDGVELEIEFLYPNGNDASKAFGRTLQESLKELDIKITLSTLEWATFLQRIKSREFDSCNLAWVPPLESDPEQLWHSKWGKRDLQSSNNSGITDPKVDEMIVGIQSEVDRDARMQKWKAFHAYLYDIQPYLFMYNIPKKFGASLRVRGIQHSPISPGYMIRDWYFVDEGIEGTRKTL